MLAMAPYGKLSGSWQGELFVGNTTARK